MELRHLRYFVCVAEAGGFTAAAARLHTVQPSLSRQIRDLETHVGTPLFERTSRHVALTVAGRIFLDEARLTLAQADRAVERARQAAREQSGRLALGFVFGVEAEQLLRVMDVLRDEPVRVELQIHSQSSPLLIAALQERRIDAAFIRPSTQAQGLRMQTLHHERLIAALPAGHRLASRRHVRLADLVDEPFVRVTREDAPVVYDAIETYCAQHGITLHPAYDSENLMMALSLISSVGGVSLLPEHAARLFPRDVIAVPLAEPSPKIELVLAWHPDNPSPALAAFLKNFRRAANAANASGEARSVRGR